MFVRILLAIGLVLLSLSVSPPAKAAQCTCSFTSATLAFGSYAFNGPAINATGSITVNCNAPGASRVTYTLALSGTNNRTMGATAPFLQYALYQDAGHVTPWQGTNVVTVTQPDGSRTTSVYGQIPAGQNVTSGSYSGNPAPTVSLTINKCQ